MQNHYTPEEQAQINFNILIGATEFGDQYEQEEKRGRRDPITGRFVTHSDYGSDTNLVVTFSTTAILNKAESSKAGTLKYIDADFISIMIPGNGLVSYHGPVTDFYQWRFKKEYEAFKAGKDAVQTGTPLAHWIEVSPSVIKELEYHGIRTVEQVANLSDSSSGVLRSFHAMKAKAKKFLEEANDKSVNSLLHLQLDQQTSEIAEMKAQMAALLAQMNAKDEPKPKKGSATDK